MNFLTFAVLALVALVRGEDRVQEKRGAVDYAAATAAPAASLAYTKIQQPVVAQKTVLQAAPQQYYTQQAPVFQQYQYQPQAVAYSQPQPQQVFAKYAAPAALAKVAVARPQFSLAGDVSTFTYSSPVVQYSNLGVLSQIAGKLASPVQQSAKVAYAAQPAPVAYQVAAAPAPVAYATAAPQPVKVAQQYVAAAPQQQQYLPQQYIQAQAAPQHYVQQAQTVSQAAYAPAPQYYSKYATPGVSYAEK